MTAPAEKNQPSKIALGFFKMAKEWLYKNNLGMSANRRSSTAQFNDLIAAQQNLPPNPEPSRSLSPLDFDLERITAEEKILMLVKYKSACQQYKMHLLSEIMDEFESLLNHEENHPIFALLTPRNSNTGKELTTSLKTTYYSTNNTPDLTKAIDHALRNSGRPLHLAWEKYKIVSALAEKESVEEFHETLDQNKMTLTTRRDTALMDFAKCCGLFVISILGLPLGIVGGAYFGYKYLFGEKSTQGHTFVNNIIEARVNPEDEPRKWWQISI